MSSSPETLLPEAAAELARQGKSAELSTLLQQGLGVDLQDAKGNTLLMLASYHGHAATVTMLLKAGASVDRRNEKGQTPLGGVAFKGYAEIATLLLDAGADPLADQGGSTPVDYATMFGRQEILTLLRERRGAAAKPTRWFSKFIGWMRNR
jgi:ankyrin repeat protein